MCKCMYGRHAKNQVRNVLVASRRAMMRLGEFLYVSVYEYW